MLLRTQDRILLALSFLEDLFEDLADAGGLMSFSYKQIYGFVPRKYKKSNFMSAVSYALRTAKIEKILKDGMPYLRLTGKGKKKLVRDFPLIQLQKKNWDRFWRVLPYDIKEAKRNIRDRLRDKLYELGFRQFQQSVYLSPHPIEKEMAEFLETIRLEGKAHVLLCKEILGIDNKDLARKLWELDKLNRAYKKLFQKLKIASQDKDLRDIEAKYLEILTEETFLPQDLLPKPWWGDKLRKELKRVLTK